MNVITLTKALIACPSVTPETAGAFDVIEQFLAPLGFVVHRVTFEGDGGPPTENLYARYGTTGRNFCFAGHTDVVPPGDIATWKVPPFVPEIIDGELYGRGAEDMKGAIAAFMVAAKEFLHSPLEGESKSAQRDSVRGNTAATPPHGSQALTRSPSREELRGCSISLLITQDEEGSAINGTRKMLDWLAARGERLDACVVGEPTNPDRLGEMMKVGRRGSAYFTLTVEGKQGHVAYPDRADNPITRLVNMLHALKAEPIDAGTEFFPPSNLEITTVDVGNATGNVIPARARAEINVRFNSLHTGETIAQWVRAKLDPLGAHTLQVRVTGESFITRDEALIEVVRSAVETVTGERPTLSTTGGTSDARFIKDVCPVVEFGTTGRTPHMVNERVEVAVLESLARVYGEVLKQFFA
ncbi:MAG: succinyl-diaminopimelate desuccinylase [Rickettsiales bacterium]